MYTTGIVTGLAYEITQYQKLWQNYGARIYSCSYIRIASYEICIVIARPQTKNVINDVNEDVLIFTHLL